MGLLVAGQLLFGARERHERVSRQGGSVFLGLGFMQVGYSLLQPMVKLAVRWGVRPNTISWGSVIPAIAAGVWAAQGHWGFAAWGLLVSALLDVLDGAVARTNRQASRGGSILDSVLDRYVELAMFVGALVFYHEVLWVQILVLMAMFGSLMVTYSTAKAEAMRLIPPRGAMKRSDRITLLVVGAALSPVSQYWWEQGQETIVAAGPMVLAIGLIAVGANVSAVRRLAALGREADYE